MPRPGFVLDVDRSTPPVLFHHGEGFRLEKLPAGRTRVIYPGEPLEPVDDVTETIRKALHEPVGMDPLPSLLRPGMKLTIAMDDISLPLPPMVLPDVRQVILEEILGLLRDAAPITANMEQRGGGVLDIELIDLSELEPDYYQLKVHFETCDSMGANFINTVLEEFGGTLVRFVDEHPAFEGSDRDLIVIMSILSNYTPECIVRAWVECPVDELNGLCADMDGPTFADRIRRAVRIAHIDPHRAATHNKGIFNGVDAVVLATGNDFRAIEACGHTFAARDGKYRSLSDCSVEDGKFRFWLDLPIAVGTVGGLTRLHPLASRSLELLGNPSAAELMSIIAAVGLAQNFAALRSLVTTGIQKGHMKMHLQNILHHLGATEREVIEAVKFFKDHVVSFSAVRDFLEFFRQENKLPDPTLVFKKG